MNTARIISEINSLLDYSAYRVINEGVLSEIDYRLASIFNGVPVSWKVREADGCIAITIDFDDKHDETAFKLAYGCTK